MFMEALPLPSRDLAHVHVAGQRGTALSPAGPPAPLAPGWFSFKVNCDTEFMLLVVCWWHWHPPSGC